MHASPLPSPLSSLVLSRRLGRPRSVGRSSPYTRLLYWPGHLRFVCPTVKNCVRWRETGGAGIWRDGDERRRAKRTRSGPPSLGGVRPQAVCGLTPGTVQGGGDLADQTAMSAWPLEMASCADGAPG